MTAPFKIVMFVLLVVAALGTSALEAVFASELPVVTRVPALIVSADGSMTMTQLPVYGDATTMLCFGQRGTADVQCLRSVGKVMHQGQQVGIATEMFDTKIAVPPVST